MAAPSLRDILAGKPNHYPTLSHSTDRPLPSLSIVISWFHGQGFWPHVQAALAAQTDQAFQLIIVVDSPGTALPELDPFLADRVKVVRHARNYGGPAAKNTGLNQLTTDAVLFLDQDMVLPVHAVATFRQVLATGERVVAVGFRGTADSDSHGRVPASTLAGDWRCQVTPDGTYLPVTASRTPATAKLRTYRLLEETDDFREFGTGRAVGLWDLPSMVVGHTVAVHAELVREAGGFPEHFTGWGTDDTALGACMIAAGGVVVPVKSVVSTQIAHRPWSGSRTVQLAELAANVERYRTMLDSPHRMDGPAQRVQVGKGRSAVIELRQ